MSKEKTKSEAFLNGHYQVFRCFINHQLPNCPYEDGTPEKVDYLKGWEQGEFDLIKIPAMMKRDT